MKISLEWLSEYLPGKIDPKAAAEALTGAGLPVEVIESFGADTVIDVEVTSNRPDCLSYLGIARELSALLKLPFREINIAAPESATPASSATSVVIEALDLCPHYTARVLRNVKVGPSPAWMVRRLEAMGQRSVNNIVDVTNYVMFETGQPLHAFDFDRLAEHRIVVRRARGDEKLTSIDGHERQLSPDMLAIADARRPVAIAGVMGGLDTEVSQRTTNVLLESARFEPLSVRRTARGLTMKSESSYRFERQIDPTLPPRASLRAAQLFLQTAGGELLSGLVEAGASNYKPKSLTLTLAKLRRVLGIDISPELAMDALSRLHLSPVLKGDRIEVSVPSYRLDLNIEVDLVEEVARLIGYDRIPQRDTITMQLVPPDPRRITMDQIKDVLTAAGYFEAVTVTFVSDKLRDDFLPPGAATLPRAQPMTRAQDAHLRPSLLPGLLESVRRNETVGTLGAKLFEVGSIFWNDASGALVEQRRLALVGGEDLREVRGAVEALLSRLNAERLIRIVPEQRAGFAGGAAGRIEWASQSIGHLGKIHPAVAEKLSLRQIPAGAELEIDALLDGAQHVPQLKPLPRFPSIVRDLSLVVAESVQYEQIESLLRSLSLPSLEDIAYVTTYRGKPLEKGAKSVTVELIFRSPEGTLTSEQVEGSVQQATEAAKTQLGATLRV